NDKQVSEVMNARSTQPLTCFKHSGNDSFGVACPAAIEVLIVFTDGQHGRHCVNVSAEYNLWLAGECEHVRSAGLHFLQDDAIARFSEMDREKVGHLTLIPGDRWDLHQLPGQFKRCHVPNALPSAASTRSL